MSSQVRGSNARTKRPAAACHAHQWSARGGTGCFSVPFASAGIIKTPQSRVRKLCSRETKLQRNAPMRALHCKSCLSALISGSILFGACENLCQLLMRAPVFDVQRLGKECNFPEEPKRRTRTKRFAGIQAELYPHVRGFAGPVFGAPQVTPFSLPPQVSRECGALVRACKCRSALCSLHSYPRGAQWWIS